MITGKTTVAPLLASRVFFANTIDTSEGLKNVQWVYLGVAGFVALLIVLFFVAPMPEITDADMNAQEGEIGHSDPGPFRKQYNLFLAIWSQFCYVGAQVAVAVWGGGTTPFFLSSIALLLLETHAY